MLASRVLDQASVDAIDARKKEKFITLKEFARSIPPCEALDYIKQHYPELFEPLNHKQKQL
jgi:hypothetical protein